MVHFRFHSSKVNIKKEYDDVHSHVQCSNFGKFFDNFCYLKSMCGWYLAFGFGKKCENIVVLASGDLDRKMSYYNIHGQFRFTHFLTGYQANRKIENLIKQTALSTSFYKGILSKVIWNVFRYFDVYYPDPNRIDPPNVLFFFFFFCSTGTWCFFRYNNDVHNEVSLQDTLLQNVLFNLFRVQKVRGTRSHWNIYLLRNDSIN